MKKVMTVDDSVTVRRALSITLSEAGYEVCEASDGIDALGQLENYQVDMLVTDLNMPNMDGIDLIRRVRQMPGNRFMPIIMLTSKNQPDMKVQGKKAGASGWVTKPFSQESLLAVVKMVCPVN